jgi:6-bladed beta-propeller
MTHHFLTTVVLSLLATTWGVAHDEGNHSHASSDPTSAPTALGPIITGSGAHTYENVPGWGTLPDGKLPGPLHGGVAVDRAGLIYFSTDTQEGVRVFSADGQQVKTIGGADLARGHSLTHRVENGEDVFYAAVQGSKFVKFDSSGKILLSIPNENTGEFPVDATGQVMGKTFKGATSVTADGDGNLYAVCGYGNNLAYKFDKTGKFIKAFGERGKGDGQFSTCHGIALDERYGTPRLLISDRENGRLQHFDLDGKFIAIHATGLRRPCAASFFGEFTASAELQGGVAIYDKEGKFVTRLGDNPDKSQWANFQAELVDMKAGFFTAPHGLSYDKDGNLYILEWNKSGRINKLIKKGS